MPSSTFITDSGLASVEVITQNLAFLTQDADPRRQQYGQQFLHNFLLGDQLLKVLGIHDMLFEDACRVPSEEIHCGRSILGDAVIQLQPIAMRYPAARELHRLLTQPYVKHLLSAYDDVCNCRFQPELGEVTWPGPGNEDFDMVSNITDQSNRFSLEEDYSLPRGGLDRAVFRPSLTSQPSIADLPRQIGIRKELHEPLGLTVVRKDVRSGNQIRSQIVVERIIAGSVIDKQALLSVGDVILAVNDQPIETPEALQRLLKQISHGTITMKILSGHGRNTHPSTESLNKCFMRSFFTYEPERDTLLPSGNIGLPFEAGDILEILSKDDVNFWQARHTNRGVSSGPVGLIPSTVLEERRKAFCRSTANDAHHPSSGKKKDKKVVFFRAMDASNVFSRSEVWTYEEVVQVPASQVTCLVLVGPTNIGKEAIKKALCGREPTKFAYPVTDTSARLTGNMRDYLNSMSRSQMEIGIRAGDYAEWSEVAGDLRGVRFSAIREIIDRGRTAVLDCQVKSVRNIRLPELNPHVVFVAAPALEVLMAMQSKGLQKGVITSKLSEHDLKEVVNQSTRFERHYRHIYQSGLLNDNFEVTIDRLLQLVRTLERQPGWIPASWELDRVPLLPPLPLSDETPPSDHRPRYSKRGTSSYSNASLQRMRGDLPAVSTSAGPQILPTPRDEAATPYAQLEYPELPPGVSRRQNPRYDPSSYEYAEIQHPVTRSRDPPPSVPPPPPPFIEGVSDVDVNDDLAPHFVESKLRPFRISQEVSYDANDEDEYFHHGSTKAVPAAAVDSSEETGNESETGSETTAESSEEESDDHSAIKAIPPPTLVPEIRPLPSSQPLETEKQAVVLKLPPVPLSKPPIPQNKPPIPRNKPQIPANKPSIPLNKPPPPPIPQNKPPPPPIPQNKPPPPKIAAKPLPPPITHKPVLSPANVHVVGHKLKNKEREEESSDEEYTSDSSSDSSDSEEDKVQAATNSIPLANPSGAGFADVSPTGIVI